MRQILRRSEFARALVSMGLTWLAVVSIVLLYASCTSVPLKQKVATTHQTLHTALIAADDLERQLCAPDPARVNHCTSPSAVTIGLTDALHQDISRRFVKAYETDLRLSAAIIAWKAGDPPPSDLTSLVADAQATYDAVKPLTGIGTALADKVQTWLDKAAALAALFTR